MKKYKINRGFPVNTRASKNGVKWEYGGKKTLEDAQEMIKDFEETIEWRRKVRESGGCVMVGLRVTDTESSEVIFEKMI